MRKKLLVLGLAAILGISSVSVTNILTNTSKVIAAQSDDDDEDDGGDWDEGEYDEVDPSGGVTNGDVVVSPAKKTIKVGKSFTIALYPSTEFEKENEDLPDEEWEELLEEGIDGIKYRSTRSSVASVNSKGKVKGKKKGSAIIKTTISFSDGSEGTYKTKVYVTK